MKNKLEKVMYMVLGGVLTLSGYMFGTLNSGDVEAQQGENKIVCQQLEVVDSRGRTIAVIGEEDRASGTSVFRIYNGVSQSHVVDLVYDEDGGMISAFSRDGRGAVSLRTDADGGRLDVFGKDGKVGVVLSNDDVGGVIAVASKDGEGGVLLTNDADGGFVSVRGKEGKGGAALANSVSGGNVNVFGKDGRSGVFLTHDATGGSVLVQNKFGRVIGSVP